MRELLKLFGVYDLREEGREWCVREFGEQYGEEFVEKYDSIKRGIPIGGFVETAIFLDMVKTIKAETKKKTIMYRIGQLIKERVRQTNEFCKEHTAKAPER